MPFRRLITAAVVATLAAAQSGPPAATLQAGKAVERELAGGQGHLYRLTLAPGEYAGIAVEQRGIDVTIQVLNADANVIAEVDFESRKQGQEFVGLVADSATEYGIRIRARYKRSISGHYEVCVRERRAATARDRSVFEAHKLSIEAVKLESAGKSREALRLAERALALGEEGLTPADAYLGYLVYRQASLKRVTGEYDQSERLFQRALAFHEKLLGRKNPQTASVLRAWGRLHMAVTDFSKAERLFEEALDIDESTLGTEHPILVADLRFVALVRTYRGDLERALTALQRASTIAEKEYQANDAAILPIIQELGGVYLLLGDNQRAEPLFERALAITEQNGPDNVNVTPPLQGLGSIARQRKQYAKALELFWRAHDARQKRYGSRHPDVATLLENIAFVYSSMGEHEKALELHHQALDTLEATAGPYHRYTLQSLRHLGDAYAAQGNLARAIEYRMRHHQAMERNIALNLTAGSEREKLAYLASTSYQTDRTISLHASEAPNDRTARDLAALVLLQRKGRVLDAISGSMAALRDRLSTKDRQLLDELDQNNAKLARLALRGAGKMTSEEYRNQLTALERRTEKLESEISADSAELRAQSQEVTLAAVQAAIPEDAALIEYAVYRPYDVRKQAYGDPRYIAYVFRRAGEIQWRDLGPARETDAAIEAFRQALRDSRRQDVRQLAGALGRKMIDPLRAAFGGAKQLLISPDGELNLIPFEALADKDAYLLDEYLIGYLTTGRDLLRMQLAREAKHGPVVLANPAFGQPQTQLARARFRSITTAEDLSATWFAPLAGTREEAQRIQSLFPDAEILSGERAAKSALKDIQAPSILHIATHGFFLKDAALLPKGTGEQIVNPLLRSGLALAGANLKRSSGEEGILTALEASGLNLWGTKLVTLSACDTGVGEVKNGEGVYGLRRAFVLAGAETLVMSLWPVSDRITREMMGTFYTGLKNGLGRGEALRQAKLAMLKRSGRSHPFYWASFIQSGDWTSLGH